MYRIDSTIILPNQYESYQNIITIHPRPKPNSNLYKYVSIVRSLPLSKFQYANEITSHNYKRSNCVYAFIKQLNSENSLVETNCHI